MKIELKGIQKTYIASGKEGLAMEVLKGIDLTVEQGAYISFTGRSGCGKTTLLKIMGLLLPPTKGEVVIDGKKISGLWSDELADIRRRKMGFVFQDYELLGDITAFDNVILPGLLDKRSREELKTRVSELTDCLEIPSVLLGKYPQELSGGEKQKIAIARALCNDPPCLFADEPTGNLDDASRKTVEDIFDMLHRDMNKTILLVTHDLDFAEKSEQKYVLRNGRLYSGSFFATNIDF